MAHTEGSLPVGGTGKLLDTTVVPQTDLTLVHREIVSIGDPETFGLIAHVVPVGSQDALLVSKAPMMADMFRAFGEHTISGAQNNVDIWGGPTNIQPEPDPTGYSLYVISSSGDDTGISSPQGIGARSVEVHYLDTAGVQQEVTVILNGTTEVDSGVTDCMFVQEMHSNAVGTNSVAVGNVDALAGTGGAVVQRITATGNQSMSTMRQVPAGFNLIITSWRAVGAAATTKRASMRIRSSDHDGISTPGVYHFRDVTKVKDFATSELSLRYLVPSLAVLKISTWTDGTIDVSAGWTGFLEPT